MKKALVIFLLISMASCSCCMAQVIGPDGAWLSTFPARLDNTISPTADMLAAAGYRLATAEEIAARDAQAVAEQNAIQEQAALYADPEPTVFVPRYDGDLSNVVGQSQILVDADTGEVVAVDETGSPEHTKDQKQAQLDARNAKKAASTEAIRAAKEAKTDKDFRDAVIVFMEVK